MSEVEPMGEDTFVGVRIQVLRRWLGNTSPGVILDLGGRPSTAAALRDSFPSSRIVVGNLERNPRAARWSVVCFDGESMPIRRAAVDLVFCSEVLEHVHHPDMFLAELRRVLRSGGDLFLTTPNMAAWHNRILLPLGYPPANYTAYPHKRLGAPSFIQGLDAEVQDHPRVFTRAALLEALGLHDLTIVNDSAISYAVPGRPLFRMRRALDPLIPKTWKEDLVVWARAGSTKEEGRAP